MDFDEYQHLAMMTRLENAASMSYMALGLNGEAGEIANKIKKIIRGDIQNYDALFHDLLYELGDVLWYIAGLADECGYSLSEIAQANIEKLQRRAELNTIMGDGDDR